MVLSHFKYRKTSKCTHYVQIGDIKIPNVLEDNSIPNQRLRCIFLDMLRRCYDKQNKDYRFYGEKGVKVCQEWIENPNLFYEWAISNDYTNEYTIDRIQDNKEYSSDNCRWVSLTDNSRFKGNTNYITATVTLSGKQWASLIPEHGVNFINRMIKKQGEDKTVEYIEKRLANKHLN